MDSRDDRWICNTTAEFGPTIPDIEVIRFLHRNDYTLSLLNIDGEVKCFGLEDEKRNKKVYGETCIPEGTYKLTFRRTGGFHNRYKKRFGEDFHKGMLWIRNVPGFKYVLIHIGNTDEDTAGCILTGLTADMRKSVKNGFVRHSTDAYKAIYPLLRDKLLEKEELTIRIRDLRSS